MSEVAMVSTSQFFEKTFEENLKKRKIVLNDEVSQDVIETIVLQILKYNEEDKDIPAEKRKTIFIYVNSVGGDVFNGLACCTVIKQSITPVVGVVLGYAYSMGGLIFLSCHKRLMLPTSSLLIHDGSTTLSGSNNKVKDLQKFYAKIDDVIKNIIVDNSKISSEEYDENVDRELYLMADECKQKGLCDAILGVDCGLGEII